MSLEDTLATWASAPGKTEQEQSANAESAIRKAVAASTTLNGRRIEVFTHGSYRNRVTIRGDSDVDVAVLCRDTFYYYLPQGVTASDYGITPATYSFGQFKRELGQALVNYFGSAAVTPGDKAFDIRENTYRIDADAAPFFEYRWYTGSSYHEGVELITDSSGAIVNWPQQHYDNCVAKNDRTSRAFKGVVRILKRAALTLEQDGQIVEGVAPGFLIECMAYNVPDHLYDGSSWTAAARNVLAYLHVGTATDESCSQWTEGNGLKPLFRPTQKWNRANANHFVTLAWRLFHF